jgi:hypothetical protein
VVGKRSIDNGKSETRLSSDIRGDPVQLIITGFDSQEGKEMAVRVLDSLKTVLGSVDAQNSRPKLISI